MRNRVREYLPLLAAGGSFLAGVALSFGVSYAAHPNVILKTYEEVSAQGMAPDGSAGPYQGAVMVNTASRKGMPYSPKQTCGGASCHSYESISNHAFHSAQGYNEWNQTPTGAFDSSKPKPWTQGNAMYGKW